MKAIKGSPSSQAVMVLVIGELLRVVFGRALARPYTQIP